MKILLTLPLLLGFLYCSSTLSAQKQTNDLPRLYAEVLYIQSSDSNLVRWESTIWKPIYQSLIENGFSTGWQLFSVTNPAQSSPEYNYVLVHYYTTLDQLNLTRRGLERAFEQAHPEKDLSAILKHSDSLRTVVYTEIFELKQRRYPAKNIPKGTYFFLQTKQVPRRNIEEFLEFEEQASDSSSMQSGFENRTVWEVVSTDLSGWDYNFAIVENWSDQKEMISYQRPSGKDIVLDEDRKRKNSWIDQRTETWILEDQWFTENRQIAK